MKYQKGDIVLIGNGRVHWELVWTPRDGWWWAKSGMSERRAMVSERRMKPWKPHD